MQNNAALLEQAKRGDKSASEQLVEGNMGLVYSVVGRYSGRRAEAEDLVQIGAIGLIKAINQFDMSYGVKFSTYAVPMIIGEIKRFLRDDGSIKVSRAVKETAAKARYAEELLRRRLGRDPTVGEISEECNISAEDITAAFEAVTEPCSLQTANAGDDSRTLMDSLGADDTEEQIVDRVFLAKALANLSERERNVIGERYFKGKTQSEIAVSLGVSQVQVSRIEKKALMKLREQARE
ncbi:MAG: SigB/SigF/SigG family RNA polymerase sigma factor [Clostridia bacterium]|nr:SigB/SigF/SigG family RNA polymerase sigma factor [Clostridia bacterium]